MQKHDQLEIVDFTTSFLSTKRTGSTNLRGFFYNNYPIISICGMTIEELW